MSDEADRRRTGEPVEAGDGLIMIDLRKELRPEELESFLAKAAEAGRTPEEHFKAITIAAGGEEAA